MRATPDETITSLSRALREGQLDAVDLTKRCLERIDADDTRINAFAVVFEAEALASAKRADEKRASGLDLGPLHGVPVALKHNFDCAGHATTGCCEALRDNIAASDAEVVTRLREAGAIIIGKTNMHELAYGGTGQVSSAGPIRNPRDSGRLAGGSSSGSAAAVAAGMVPAALGSDTGGSVRIPSATCGVVGFKPSFDHISVRGVMPLSWTLDHVGPIARTVEDAATLSAVLTRSGDTAALTPSSSELRIGVARFPDLALDPDVGKRFGQALAAFKGAGHVVDHFDLTYTREGHQSWLAIMYPEASARYERLLDERYSDFDITVRTQLEAGRHVNATTYLQAQRFRAFYGRHIAELAASYDLICMPTLPIVAPKVGQSRVELPSGTVSTQDAMTFSNLTANMLGWPAITVPMATREGELPAGLTLLRPVGQDEKLLAEASALARLIN